MACIGNPRELGAGDRLRELPGAARRETEILFEGNSQQVLVDGDGRLARAYGGPGVVAGVVETPWTGGVT
jgi:hypothetical protein